MYIYSTFPSRIIGTKKLFRLLMKNEVRGVWIQEPFFFNIMAQGKKSFIAYSDWRDTFDQLPDEDAGKLIKHIFAYVNDEEPESESVLINAVFAQIRNTLKRDLKKWDKQLEQRREAGKRSAEARAAKSNDRSTTVNERQRNSTDSVSVSDSDSDSVSDSDSDNVNKEDNNIESRKLKFAQSLEPYLEKYGKEVLNEFYHYWTEHNDNGKKMRFEYAKNQPFNIGRRLGTWIKNERKNQNFKSGKKRGEGVNEDYLNELHQRIYGNGEH